MIETIKKLIDKYYEQLAYLFFGGVGTLLNIVLALLFRWMGMSTTWNTLLDNVICILFAYCTNRTWVFRSRSTGMAMVREFGSFVGCRLGTLVMDVAIMWVGVDLVGARFIHPVWQGYWFLAVKLVDQVLVILFNYIFSKLIIFKKGQNN